MTDDLGLDILPLASETSLLDDATISRLRRYDVGDYRRGPQQLEIPWGSAGGAYHVRGVRGSSQPRARSAVNHIRVTRFTTGIKTAIQATDNMSAAAGLGIEKRAQAFADTLRTALRSAATEAYRSGTGRFARGLNVRVKIKRGGTTRDTQAIVEVMVPGYRESRFLTNLGNQGRFKEFPVAPYWIYARGATKLEVTHSFHEPLTGKNAAALRARLKRSKRVGRLKIPLSEIGLISRAPAGKRKETILEPGFPLEPGMAASSQFVYPLQVHHPGFPRDVVSEVTYALGGEYEEATINGVKEVFVSKRKTFGGLRIGQAGAGPSTVMGQHGSDRYATIIHDSYVRGSSSVTRQLASQEAQFMLRGGQ